jgi:geranylgeranyl pyrophosphate synthase
MTSLTQEHRAGPPGDEGIKHVPQDAATRALLRHAAVRQAARSGQAPAPALDELQGMAADILSHSGLPGKFLGFAMVALDNAFWENDFRAVPCGRRLLLLPKCLSSSRRCSGTYDSIGLHCAGCGACSIHSLQTEAEALGYQVIVAEGTSSVISRVLEGSADAVLGVACLDSLEKSFDRISDLGIPHQSVPLLTNGCRDTTAEVDLIRELLTATGGAGPLVRRTYLPLLRTTHDIFESPGFSRLLEPYSCPGPHAPGAPAAMTATDHIARDWLRMGGKRLRPFVTVAAYAVGRHGAAALAPQADLHDLLPTSVHRLAVAIEAMHKASLVHDDIEDRDPYRYGRPTLHRTHGTGAAINVGDYLVGLGYRLIAAQAPELGAACVVDILGKLSAAHLRLCCGQGTELLWDNHQESVLKPIDALRIGSLKTAPAFEVALYAGLRAAEAPIDEDRLRRFSAFVGEGYQVLNDLTDWEEESANKVSLGQDVLAQRPTILRAFALEAGGGDELAAIMAGEHSRDPAAVVDAVRGLYRRLGAFARAEALHSRLRDRALGLAAEFGDPALQQLMSFLVRNVLRFRRSTHGGPTP